MVAVAVAMAAAAVIAVALAAAAMVSLLPAVLQPWSAAVAMAVVAMVSHLAAVSLPWSAAVHWYTTVQLLLLRHLSQHGRVSPQILYDLFQDRCLALAHTHLQLAIPAGQDFFVAVLRACHDLCRYDTRA